MMIQNLAISNMKLALRYIPTEVWVDVFIFPWISRKRLGRIVHRFKNRKFIEILQYCLHDRGKRTMDFICVDKGTIIPRTPLPENIKVFQHIIISHFDSEALDFLRLISGLFTDVNLNLLSLGPEDDLTKLRTLFDHLAPMLYGVHSLTFHQCAIPLVEQHFAPKLAQIKMLAIFIAHQIPEMTINFCLNWLTSEVRDPGEPRFLKMCTYWDNFQQFCNAIQQQFHSAKRPCTFAIECSYLNGYDPNFRLDLENNLGEQLHGEFNKYGNFQILRHPVNFARTQLQEWVNQTAAKRWASNVIEMCGELTIGPLDVNVGGNEVDEAGEEEADGPSTSKKPKMTQ